jgi:hypothetical protein
VNIPAPIADPSPVPPVDQGPLEGPLDPAAKKARNLNKKVRFRYILRNQCMMFYLVEGYRGAQREGQTWGEA